MRNNYVMAGVLIVGCALAGQAFCDEVSDELKEIGTQRMVEHARAQMLDERAKAVAKQAEIERQRAAMRKSGDDETNRALPEVFSIERVGKARSATLEYAGGATLDVVRGDRLPGGWVVESVDAKEVLVKQGQGKKGAVRRLAMRGEVARPASEPSFAPQVGPSILTPAVPPVGPETGPHN